MPERLWKEYRTSNNKVEEQRMLSDARMTCARWTRRAAARSLARRYVPLSVNPDISPLGAPSPPHLSIPVRRSAGITAFTVAPSLTF